MRAAQISQYGHPEVLITIDDAPVPSLQAGQVLVRVQAAGANPFDWKVCEGYMQQMAQLTFPATLGGDLSGVVTEIGEGVEGIKPGDRVFGQANALSGHGSFAEYAPVAATQLAPAPTSIDAIHAAALPLASVSAYQALVEHAALQPGQKILIHGGAGGIGSLAIQLAKHLGAEVITTAAAADADFVKSLGAHTVIDYHTQDFSTILRDLDVVYDTIGGDITTKSYQVLRPGGVLVSMVAQPDPDLVASRHVTFVPQFTRVTTAKLTEIARLVDAGRLIPLVEHVYPLAQAGQALAHLQRGAHRGKIVLDVAP